MLGQNKTVNYVVGGIAVASVALLAYSLTRPTKPTKRGKKRRSTSDVKRKKLEFKFTKKPIDIHLVMESMDGFNALIAGDKKNQKLKVPYGSRLVKINNKRVDNMPFEDIMKTLQSTKCPIVLKFKAMDDLCVQWTKAEALKEEANALYKSKKVEAAIDKVSLAISHHPTNRVYYSNRILMYLNQKSYDLAMNDCKKIRELDPQSTYIKGHYLRGLTLQHLKKYKNAASAFQTVIKLNDGFSKAKDRLDECLKELKSETDRIQQRRSSQQEELKKQFMAQNEPSNEQEDGAKAESKEEEVKEVKEVKAEQTEAVGLKDDEKEAVVPNDDNNKDDGNDENDAAPDEPVVVESAEKVQSVDEEDNKKSEVDKVGS